ncbi:pyridoxamine 5'-phosphate oxidase family protein [Oxalobacteraceae bacterium R-40]|uniref:Pyridoxamine 5'-phosphate oxidase family protein n=1 Tax=Keguizhuia sedimenti TaxID=3064264 RepID=A0ABU1BLZ8_9BURK|nr:pyridoxamine 5'-phosphate oxidase family protein [Oxalobacteraceae bacterium R-40]
MDDTYRIADLTALERIYGPPAKFTRKESDHIHSGFREFIERAPFMVLATCGLNGLAASAKGDVDGFVKVLDEKTLLIPDRGANGRNDSLRNIVVDPRTALIFFIPGEDEMVRVNGHAHLSTNPELLDRFAGEGKPARCVIVVRVNEALCQCSRAIQKSGLWESRAARDAVAAP